VRISQPRWWPTTSYSSWLTSPATPTTMQSPWVSAKAWSISEPSLEAKSSRVSCVSVET
jgi:hypothetical protein